MFKLYAFLVNTLAKVRHIMNWIMIRRERKDWYLTKSFSFDIQSLADQLYKFCSIYPKEFYVRKIYFLENLIPDFVAERIKHLAIVIILFNKFVQENKLSVATCNKAKKKKLFTNNPIDLCNKWNLEIDELFF